MATAVEKIEDTSFNSASFQQRVNALRGLDNITNWFHLVGVYAYLSVLIAAAILFFQSRPIWALAWLWNVPVALAAITLVGVGQHRLVMLAHEASHYSLFRNRLLNELASDWFCMFPLLGTTHNYRLQHMPHHQFVNDQDRDPDLGFMQASGHHIDLPTTMARFIWDGIVKQLVAVPRLIRYMRTRARYVATGGTVVGLPPVQGQRSPLLIGAGVGYIVVQAGLTTALAYLGNTLLLALLPAVLWATMIVFYALVPERLFPKTAIKPDVPPRWWTYQRLTYITIVFAALAWLTVMTGRPCGVYYVLLWIVPLLTAFPFFMILREELQHGGAGRERFSHSRNFEGNALVRFAVFPLGMAYHLPHHLFPMVPHYRLRRLHRLLGHTDVYRDQAPSVAQAFPR